MQVKGIMEESKRKKIEAQLRQLFVNADQLENKNYTDESRSTGVKVIRRRKGAPDREIK
jgi:hypothetical protein